MDLEITDKVAFIAGSSRGIGREIARRFLREGARVTISGRETEHVERTANELATEFGREKILRLAGDLTEAGFIQDSIEKVLSAWGTIDALVANVGSGRATPGWQFEPEEWMRIYEVNLFGSMRLTQALLPHLVKHKKGSVVLIGSIAGIEATKAPLGYGSAKAALAHYGKNLARQLGAEGVRVNVVAPGNILFPGGTWETHLAERREQVVRYIESEVPLGRFGKPEEIADIVVFLCSPRASFATGMTLAIDGGQVRSL
jgi:3-oxoacyl-[acyl-carrier protein] reductase